MPRLSGCADSVAILTEFGYDANRVTELAGQGIIATEVEGQLRSE
jgi:hypothetical protein